VEKFRILWKLERSNSLNSIRDLCEGERSWRIGRDSFRSLIPKVREYPSARNFFTSALPMPLLPPEERDDRKGEVGVV
jgi:hypothetical protein